MLGKLKISKSPDVFRRLTPASKALDKMRGSDPSDMVTALFSGEFNVDALRSVVLKISTCASTEVDRWIADKACWLVMRHSRHNLMF